MTKLYDLKTEYLRDPMGIDAASPRFSWKIQSDMRSVTQKSYRVIAFVEDRLIWDSGAVVSEEQCVRYAGDALRSREIVRWKVEITVCGDDVSGRHTENAAAEAAFEMGLLHASDWQAKWIEPEKEVDRSARKPALYLRRTFNVKPSLLKARIYQTAHGLYHFWLNGLPGTEELFKPGLTSYYARIQYQTYDITALLHEGENAWAVVLADGWWRGVTGGTLHNNFGAKLAYLGQLELTYADGGREVIGSDEGFRWSTGGLLASDMQMGDVYDARLEPEGWKLPGFDDSAWQRVHLSNEHTAAALIGTSSVPVREKEQFIGRPFRDGNGKLILDFGQNIAGHVRMKLHGLKAGQTVHLQHGEGLKDGCFSMDNLASPSFPVEKYQEVFYTGRGESEEEYCPMFSVFGFRYALLEGYGGEIRDGDFTAVAVYSDMEVTGTFSCSNRLINRLVSNSLWSQKGNFLDVPVDCPTRERNAWTGDAQVYVGTASLFMDTYTFYEKWLKDQAIEQYASGKVGITFPSTSSAHDPEGWRENLKTNPLAAIAGPTGNGSVGEDAVGWGDSAVWLPYMVYRSFGDPQILRNQYDCARKWLEYELTCAKDQNPKRKDRPEYHTVGPDGTLDGDWIFDTKFQYGEWLEPIPEEKTEIMKLAKLMMIARTEGKSAEEIAAEGRMPNFGIPEVATAYMYRSARTVSEMANILSKTKDAAHYREIALRIKEVYVKYMIAPDGTIQKGHQAPYVRALNLGLYRDDNQKRQLLSQLLQEIEANGYCLNTGFLSTPYLLPVLADNGCADAAFRILEQTKCPSWLHAVELGATTILERWTGMDEFKDSFNHYSYGAVCEFLFRYVAGIRLPQSTAGYKKFDLCPLPGGTLTEAEGMLETGYGMIVSGWKLEDGDFHYHCEIPCGTEALLTLPDGKKTLLKSGTFEFSTPYACPIL